MFKGKTLAAASAVAIMAASAASAATISVTTFSTAAYDAYIASVDVIAQETFEGFAVGNGDFTGTSVGDFTEIGGVGSGGSVIPGGDELAVSDDTSFGRENTTVGGSKWLDSNDTLGISWAASAGGALFGSLAFSLSDAADLGATLTVEADGAFLTDFVGQGDNTVDWVVISFGGAGVSSADITLTNSITNDGFGIDDVTIAAVPLPAGAALMLTGLGGLAIARRRKAAK